MAETLTAHTANGSYDDRGRPADMRSWLRRMEELGELQHVSGANWHLEIGAISEINYRRKPPAALLFDQIPGYPPGYRVLTGSLANARRMAVTLGLSDALDTAGLVQALRGKPLEWESSAPRFEPIVVDDAPILENVVGGAEIDLKRFPAPLWHEHDGGRYIGTGCAVVTSDPQHRGRISLACRAHVVRSVRVESIEVLFQHQLPVSRDEQTVNGQRVFVKVRIQYLSDEFL